MLMKEYYYKRGVEEMSDIKGNVEAYIRKKKRQRMLKKLKKNLETAIVIIIPLAIILALHILKKKTKKKVKTAIRSKVKDHIKRNKNISEQDDFDIEESDLSNSPETIDKESVKENENEEEL